MMLHNRNSNFGFTLIELIITMVVVGLIGTILFVGWPGKTSLVISQAAQLAQDLRYARHYAISHEISTRITFNVASKQYALTNNATSAAIILPGSAQNSSQLDTSFTLTLNNLANNYIIFDKDGLPYNTNGGSVMTSNATVSLSGDGETGVVTIRARSGSIGLPY